MKKIKNTLLILLFVFFLSLTACTKDITNTIIIKNNNPEISLRTKKIWTNQFINNDKASKTKEVNINDITYKGTYVNSKVFDKQSYLTNIYKTEDDITFGINDKTNKLSLFNMKSPSYNDNEILLDDISKPKENALTLAKTLASTLININDYEFIIEDEFIDDIISRGQTFYITYYRFKYKSKVDTKDLLSQDKLEIEVSSKGKITYINLNDINSINNDLNYDLNIINEEIKTKITNSFKVKNHEINKITIDKQEIVLTLDNKVGIYSIANVVILNDDNDLQNVNIVLLTYI